MKGGFGNMAKQIKEMQQQMLRAQEELAEERVEASAGGGIVKAVVSGKQELLEIKIDPSAVDPDDVEMLEDMVVAAINEALRQSQELAVKRLGSISGLGGLGIPGLT